MKKTPVYFKKVTEKFISPSLFNTHPKITKQKKIYPRGVFRTKEVRYFGGYASPVLSVTSILSCVAALHSIWFCGSIPPLSNKNNHVSMSLVAVIWADLAKWPFQID